MKVLVLGGSGFIGRVIVAQLQAGGHTPLIASRRPSSTGVESIGVDTTDGAALARACRGLDAVINCVAGDGRAIAAGARHLAQAVRDAGVPRLVHLSTMSVYGAQEGLIDEDAPLVADIGWYGAAKIEAEGHLQALARDGAAAVVILRPGCVVGADSPMWTTRFVRWLHARRLGDLGAAGDGWSNLVHVDDVAAASVAALTHYAAPHRASAACFNLATPDSPRWNRYFIDLALATGATPVASIGARRLRLEGKLLAPPLKLAERMAQRMRLGPLGLPEGMPPSLLRLFGQHIRLDGHAAERELGLRYTPYADLIDATRRM